MNISNKAIMNIPMTPISVDIPTIGQQNLLVRTVEGNICTCDLFGYHPADEDEDEGKYPPDFYFWDEDQGFYFNISGVTHWVAIDDIPSGNGNDKPYDPFEDYIKTPLEEFKGVFYWNNALARETLEAHGALYHVGPNGRPTIFYHKDPTVVETIMEIFNSNTSVEYEVRWDGKLFVREAENVRKAIESVTEQNHITITDDDVFRVRFTYNGKIYRVNIYGWRFF